MRTWLIGSCAVALALGALGCGGGGSGGGNAVGSTSTGSGRVIGTLLDGAGQPIAGAQVSVRNTGLVGSTQADGLFDIANIPPGTQILDITATAGAKSVTVIITASKTTNVGNQTLSGSGGGTSGGGTGGGGIDSPPAPPF